jgi:hypothetical protein
MYLDRRKFLQAISAGSALIMSGCERPQPRTTAEDNLAKVTKLADAYIKEYFDVFPYQAIENGAPDFHPDRLGDHSLEALKRWQNREDALLKQLRDIPVATIEDSPQAVTYKVLQNQLEAAQAYRACRIPARQHGAIAGAGRGGNRSVHCHPGAGDSLHDRQSRDSSPPQPGRAIAWQRVQYQRIPRHASAGRHHPAMGGSSKDGAVDCRKTKWKVKVAFCPSGRTAYLERATRCSLVALSQHFKFQSGRSYLGRRRYGCHSRRTAEA